MDESKKRSIHKEASLSLPKASPRHRGIYYPKLKVPKRSTEIIEAHSSDSSINELEEIKHIEFDYSK